MLKRLSATLPRDLAELVAFVPTRGWDAIEWRPLLGTLRQISWQLASRRGVEALTASALELDSGIRMDDHPPARKLQELSAKQKKTAGEQLLRFYFAQWRNPNGLFLDLRSARLRFDRGQLYFQPSGLWVQLKDSFRLGMIDLYRGFYRPDPVLLDDALYRMGFLRDDLTKAQADALRALLQQHFGATQVSQEFRIDTFRESFDALFDFFIEHDYRLESDFVMVGFYLITLYLALEELGQRYNVKALALDAID